MLNAQNLSVEPPPMDPLGQLVQAASARYSAHFGGRPQWIAAAPGRVNLMGGHVDYNGGCVIPLAIERYTVFAGSAIPDTRRAPVARFFSTQMDESFELDLAAAIHPGQPGWTSYMAGVVAGFVQLGHQVPPFQALIHSSVPTGSGLSSSAALEVAAATFLEAVIGMRLDKTQKALLCQTAEHRFAGVPCGIMDQFSAVYGQRDALIWLDCRNQQVELVPLDSRQVAVLVINSNAPRRLSDGRYAQRRQQCIDAAEALGVSCLREVNLSDLAARRRELTEPQLASATHVVTEIERTARFKKAVLRGDWEAAGGQLYASHASLRDNLKVSCIELDVLVDSAQQVGVTGGVFGSRLTGGGFGGCTVSLVQPARLEAVVQAIGSRYREITGIVPTAFATRPAAGAGILQQ